MTFLVSSVYKDISSYSLNCLFMKSRHILVCKCPNSCIEEPYSYPVKNCSTVVRFSGTALCTIRNNGKHHHNKACVNKQGIYVPRCCEKPLQCEYPIKYSAVKHCQKLIRLELIKVAHLSYRNSVEKSLEKHIHRHVTV